MLFNDRRKMAKNPANQALVDQAMGDIKARGNETKVARANVKSAMKTVKKAGANTPEFKAIMKGNYDGR
jgi:hypothetical protein